jgi:hypothetical protein
MPKKKTGGKPVKSKTGDDPYIGDDWVLLTEITADESVQGRVALDQEVIADYASAMLEQIKDEKPDDRLAGLKFPACILFDDGKTKWLADGFHRLEAARHTDGKVHSLYCHKYKGTKRDAILYALGANASHGLRRTSADKRKAVSLMLRDDEWKQWSSREIANQCNVSHTFVETVRNDLEQASAEAKAEHEEKGRKYRTRHGSAATMRTGKRRARKKKASAEESRGFDPIDLMTNGAIRESDLAGPDREARPDEGKAHEPDTSPVVGGDLDEIEVGREAVEKLMAEKRALEERIKALVSKVAELEAKQTDDMMSSREFQAAIRKWEDLVETQKTIIRNLQNENANLRAGAAGDVESPQ